MLSFCLFTLRSYGFLTFANEEGLDKAIETMNGKISKREIHVKCGDEKSEKPEQKKADGKKGNTYLSFTVGDRTVTAGGWAAALLAVALAFGVMTLMQNRAARAAAEEATQAMVRAYLGER